MRKLGIRAKAVFLLLITFVALVFVFGLPRMVSNPVVHKPINTQCTCDSPREATTTLPESPSGQDNGGFTPHGASKCPSGPLQQVKENSHRLCLFSVNGQRLANRVLFEARVEERPLARSDAKGIVFLPPGCLNERRLRIRIEGFAAVDVSTRRICAWNARDCFYPVVMRRSGSLLLSVLGTNGPNSLLARVSPLEDERSHASLYSYPVKTIPIQGNSARVVGIPFDIPVGIEILQQKDTLPVEIIASDSITLNEEVPFKYVVINIEGRGRISGCVVGDIEGGDGSIEFVTILSGCLGSHVGRERDKRYHNGNFEFADLPVGSYSISTYFIVAGGPWLVVKCSEQRVSITENQLAPHLITKIPFTKLCRLIGSVQDEEMRPVENCSVMIKEGENDEQVLIPIAMTDQRGMFVTHPLPVMEYTICSVDGGVAIAQATPGKYAQLKLRCSSFKFSGTIDPPLMGGHESIGWAVLQDEVACDEWIQVNGSGSRFEFIASKKGLYDIHITSGGAYGRITGARYPVIGKCKRPKITMKPAGFLILLLRYAREKTIIDIRDARGELVGREEVQLTPIVVTVPPGMLIVSASSGNSEESSVWINEGEIHVLAIE